mgnify:CR=1 FL=1
MVCTGASYCILESCHPETQQAPFFLIKRDDVLMSHYYYYLLLFNFIYTRVKTSGLKVNTKII